MLGDSVRWFGEMAKLALELVAGGRVLPLLEPAHGGRWVARWRPLLAAEADGERVAALRRADARRLRRARPRRRGGRRGGARAGRAGGRLRAARGGGARPPPDAPRRRSARRRRSGATRCSRRRRRRARAGPGGSGCTPRSAAWSRPLAPAAASGIRTCFQLTAPVDPAADADAAAEQLERGAQVDAWRLEFLLQAVDDPSLLVPAAEVWRARGALQLFRRTLEQPQERLLEDLGRALRLVPGLQPALRGARPTGMALDAEGAYRFLREGAPLLAQAGFGVRVPPWWNGPAARLGLKLRARATLVAGAARRRGASGWRRWSRTTGRCRWAGRRSPRTSSWRWRRPRCRWCAFAGSGWSCGRRRWPPRCACSSRAPAAR